jgi:hypothetical protein
MRDVSALITSWGPAEWEAFGTNVTALVAIIAAGFAWAQVRHARRLREDQAQPFVVVSFQPSAVWANAINLVVENIGNTAARNVKFDFNEPPTSKARSRDITQAALFKNGLAVMPPGMRFETLFDLTHQRQGSDLPMSYTVTVSFDGLRRKRDQMEYVLDLLVFYGLEHFREHGMHQAASSLMEISATMKRWTKEYGRLGVSSIDQDYHAWSDNWQHRKGGDFPSLGQPYPAGRRSPSKYEHLDDGLISRLFWKLALPIQRKRALHRELAEDRRLTKAGRVDLVEARKQMRGEL